MGNSSSLQDTAHHVASTDVATNSVVPIGSLDDCHTVGEKVVDSRESQYHSRNGVVMALLF